MSFRRRTQIVVGEADLSAINAALRQIPEKLRRKVARKGVREVLLAGRRMAKSLALPQDKDTIRGISIKVKMYRRKFVWGGLGVRIDGPYVEGKRFGELYAGWRSHMWDGGFRVWQKGLRAKDKPREGRQGNWKPNPNPKPFTRFNRGWRKGIARRKLNPVKIGRRLYLTTPATMMSQQARPAIVEACRQALMEVSRGN